MENVSEEVFYYAPLSGVIGTEMKSSVIREKVSRML